MPKLTLLALTLATILTPAFADPIRLPVCTRITPAGSAPEDINMRLELNPDVPGTLKPIGGVGWNVTRGNKPSQVFGNCDATTCRIGAKETPIAGQTYIREWGGQFDIATLQGTANIYDIGLLPNTTQVGVGHKTATLQIILDTCIITAPAQ